MDPLEGHSAHFMDVEDDRGSEDFLWWSDGWSAPSEGGDGGGEDSDGGLGGEDSDGGLGGDGGSDGGLGGDGGSDGGLGGD